MTTAGGKVLQILGSYSHERPCSTLSELSRSLDLPLSTTHRIVGELVAWGALERDEQGRYHVGLRLWEIGALAPRGHGLREVALPFLEDLYEITHENVQLAVRQDHEALVVERITGRRAVSILTQVGGRLPLPVTGVGQVLLAHAPLSVINEVLAAPLPRFTPQTITDPRRMRSVLADVRAHGYALNDCQLTASSVSAAVPVWSMGQVVAALSIVVAGNSVEQVRPLLPVIRAASRAISRGLGPTHTAADDSARALIR